MLAAAAQENAGECENRVDSRAIWHVWSRGVRGSAARGEGIGAAGAPGFPARVAGLWSHRVTSA